MSTPRLPMRTADHLVKGKKGMRSFRYCKAKITHTALQRGGRSACVQHALGTRYEIQAGKSVAVRGQGGVDRGPSFSREGLTPLKVGESSGTPLAWRS